VHFQNAFCENSLLLIKFKYLFEKKLFLGRKRTGLSPQEGSGSGLKWIRSVTLLLTLWQVCHQKLNYIRKLVRGTYSFRTSDKMSLNLAKLPGI